MRTNAVAHGILLVATTDDAEYIGTHGFLEQSQFPHFNCGSLDVGIFGQMFWELAGDEHDFVRKSESVKVVYSDPGALETIVVYALPAHIADRYARLSDDEVIEFAAQWSQPNGHIRMPRSIIFYERLLREVARLARIAVKENRGLFVRTQFRRAA